MASPSQAAESFDVTLDPAVHGIYRIDPALPADGKFPAGTVVKVTAKPGAGYTFDAGYYSTPGPWGAMYFESMTPTFTVKVTQALHIGVSFIEKAAVAHVDVRQDILYARPGVKPLKYDVFTPKGAKTPLPIVVIVHGGGWVTNDENIMRGLARELTRGGQLVVASFDCPLAVLSNDRLAVRQLVEEMIRQGHRRIAFAGAGGHALANSERLAGYKDAFDGPGASRLRPVIYESKGIAFADGLALGREIFAKANRPTAIQCITDDMAAGLMAATHERRLAMPEALSITGFDNFGLATRLYPALSTATLPLMKMAEAATRQVLGTLEGHVVKPLLRFPCEVVLRDSIGTVQTP